MSDRERWVLYPLLFFSLVLGLRASYLDPWSFRCREIECQSLKVSSINGAPYMNPVVFAPALEQVVRQAVQMGGAQPAAPAVQSGGGVAAPAVQPGGGEAAPAVQPGGGEAAPAAQPGGGEAAPAVQPQPANPQPVAPQPVIPPNGGFKVDLVAPQDAPAGANGGDAAGPSPQ